MDVHSDRLVRAENRWILISNASRAVIYASDLRGKLRAVSELFHPESRAKTRDLVSDTFGRKPAGLSGGLKQGGPGATASTEPKEAEAQRFAKELADELDRALRQRAFDSLVLTAPPHFLGLLRGSLAREVEKRVELTLAKDFTRMKSREVEAMLLEELGPSPSKVRQSAEA